jgi:hypothetical protein
LALGAVAIVVLLVTPGCATLRGLAVSDRPVRWLWMREPPYCRTLTKGPVVMTDTTRVALLPVAGAPSLWRGDHVAGALDDFNECVEEFVLANGWAKPLTFAGDGGSDAPELYLGSDVSEYSPNALSNDPRNGLFGFCLAGPHRRWRTALAERARSGGYDYVLLLAVTAGGLPVHRGVATSHVWLGDGHRHSVPGVNLLWGGSEVPTLLVCGALFDARGDVVRVGGEGIVCVPPMMEPGGGWSIGTPLAAALEQGYWLYDRRESLPGAPPSWSVATQNLVAELLGCPELMLR